jgi:hypothetical protein
MIEIDKILDYTKKNKGDLFIQLIEIQRLINSHRIKSVFLNISDEGFIANYIKYVKGKVCLNSIDDKHFKEFGDYDNCTYINNELEKINIQEYDLIHLDTNQSFDNWDLFISRIIRLNPKHIILSNTLKNPNQSNKIIQSIFKKHYHIDTMLEGYNGTIILKFMS